MTRSHTASTPTRSGTTWLGAFGDHLHRKLEALGVSSLVVQPRDWDELHRAVSARTQGRGQEAGRERQQERQSACAGNAGGDGVVHDPLAAWLPPLGL
ncbi:MAG: hypothetical protein R3F19_23210 [Verrucomicrobiales bacterium]